MASDRLRERIAAQFSYRSERADVWRAFDLVLDTDAFLNLGYSEWYQPHVSAASQRRLATRVGEAVARHAPATGSGRVLDVGCGRGGPAVHLADEFGFDVTGVDLVPYNVARARANARKAGVRAEFVVGDATALPFQADALSACVGVDSFVYLPDREAAIAEVADVLREDGVLVLSDLVARSDLGPDRRRAVERFADAWDMPAPATVAEYERVLADAGFDVVAVEDLTPHSVGRFRRYTTVFRSVHATPAGRLLDRVLERHDLDAAAIAEQVSRAHDALPGLRHVLLVAKR